MPAKFPRLEASSVPEFPAGRRIGIACTELAGLHEAPGIGADNHNFALALSAAGHDVTIVCVRLAFPQGTVAEWTDYFAAHGIRLILLSWDPEGRAMHQVRKIHSVQCYQWLRDQPAFDVIHFNESLGLPYFSLAAKKLGIAFGTSVLCVRAHGPSYWNREGNEALVSRFDDIIVDFMERKSIALADIVVSSSQYLLSWMLEDGWTLSQQCTVASDVPPAVTRQADPVAEPANAIRELVFFGRLEHRKGVLFFCDVVERILGTVHAPPFEITFLGTDGTLDDRKSADHIRLRAAGWSVQPKFLTELNRADALAYLSESGRLAVMPSLCDNTPETVRECLYEGIPFVASDRGGIPELVDPADWDRVLVPAVAAPFASRLLAILGTAHLPAKPTERFEDAGHDWLQWHAGLRSEAQTVQPALPPTEPGPRISVCVAHYQRPALLDQMLTSLRQQTYSNFEVLLVDDGSTAPEALAYLDGLEDDFAARGWRLLRQENSGPGVARDLAARTANGSYLLFADDDDVLFPNTLETFARAAVGSGADAFTGILVEFEGSDPPDQISKAALLIPLGAALGPGLLYPEFGGTLIFLKRQCYFDVGGFSTERDVDEDWELLLSIVEKGFDLRAIPEPLIYYRKQPMSRSRADNRFTRNRNRLRVYEKMLPRELRDLAVLAFGRLSNVGDSGAQRRLDRLVKSLESARRARSGES